MKVRCQNFRQGHIEAYRKVILKGQFKMRNQFSLGEKKQNRLVFFIRYPTSKCHFDKDKIFLLLVFNCPLNYSKIINLKLKNNEILLEYSHFTLGANATLEH